MSAEPSPPRRWFDWRVVPLAGVTALVIWLLIGKVAGAEAVFRAFESSRWQLIPIAFLLLAAVLGIGTLRWRLILSAMGHDLSFWRCLSAILAAWPLALIIPARAGDVLRSLAIRDRMPVLEGMGSVIAERFIDVHSLCLLAVVGTSIHGFHEWTMLVAALLVAQWSLLLLLVKKREVALALPVIRRVRDKLERLLLALDALAAHPRKLLLTVGASLTAWTLTTGIVQTLLVAAGAMVPFSKTLGLWPIAIFAGMLPVTVAGMGTRDAAFVYALRTTDPAIRDESVLVATLGYSVVMTVTIAAIGIPFALSLARGFRRSGTTGAEHG